MNVKLAPATPVRQGLAITAVAAVVSALTLSIMAPGSTSHHSRASVVTVASKSAATQRTSVKSVPSAPPKAPTPPKAPRAALQARIIGVGSVTISLVDPSRSMQLPSGSTVPRSFQTIVLYPQVTGAPTAAGSAAPPFPLIVFGHGFAVSPAPYYPLLDAWVRAGYVVAAPIFPLENVNAPGGPNEKDLVNQPKDMSLVIHAMTSATEGSGLLAGMMDTAHIAVTGQSDGGDTALATAYDPRVSDSRVTAAMILSGAEDPFAGSFVMPSNGPPLLAIQGTADPVNLPSDTYSFFQQASRPKYLLKLIGASHQPPYTEPGTDLHNVERMTIAFLDAYLKHGGATLQRVIDAQSAGPGSELTYSP